MKRTGIAGLLFLSLAVPTRARRRDRPCRRPDGTLVNTQVPLTGADVTRSTVRNGTTTTKTCSGRSAAGALDRAVAGDLDADAYDFGLQITTDPRPRPWTASTATGASTSTTPTRRGAVRRTRRATATRSCSSPPAGSATTGCFTGTPLDVTAPATATTGVPFTVTVDPVHDARRAGDDDAGRGRDASTA